LRNAVAILGSVVLVLPIVVVSALLKEDPEELGLFPDGETSRNVAQSLHLPGLEWCAIWRDQTF
jgi:hypothetical protein